MGTLFTRATSALSLGTLLVSTFATSVVNAASEFLPYAESLASNGIINAQSTEAGYRLADSITRAEMAKIAVNLAGVIPTGCLGTMYSDVPTSNSLCAYVEAAADAGIVSSAFANFRPSALVTRAEMTKMLLAAVGQTPSMMSAGYQDVGPSLGDLEGYINRAYELGCARAATYYRPNANSSRGEAFKIASCVAGVPPTTPPVTPPAGTGVTNTGVVVPPTGSGQLVVSLSGTAVAQYVPKNASSVNVGTVRLTAGATPVTVRSMEVVRSGLGNAADIEMNGGIRAASNGVMISSSADYYNSTSQKATLYFAPALVIPANTSVPVSVLVSLSGAENSQHKFTVTSVNANNTVVSGTPVELGFLNTTSYVTATTQYVVNNQSSVIPGRANQLFAKIDVSAGNRDTIFNGVVLTRSGASDLTKRFTNVSVYKNAVKVGSVSITNDKVIISGINSTLLAGNTETYELRGDILVDSSSSNNSLSLIIDSTSDASATEVATGYATRTSKSFNGVITFANLEVTFSKTSTGSQTVAPGTNNVTLFAGRLTSAVPLMIKKLDITPSVSGTGIGLFVNSVLSVRLNGAEIASLTSISGLQSLPVSFVVDPSTPADITIVGSVRNIPNVGTNNYTFTVNLADVRDINNNTATIGAGGSTSGDRTTVATATLTLKSATIAAPSTARLYSSAEQEIGRFALTSANEATRLTDITLTNVGTANLQNTAISTTSARLVDLDTNSSVSASVTISGNTLKFANMNAVIGKDMTKNFRILLNTTSLESYYGQNVLLTTTPANIVAVRDSNGTTLTPGDILGTTTIKSYTIGIEPPTVSVTKTSMLNKYLVTVRNVDTNTGITLSGITLRFQYRYTGNGTSTLTGVICLRDQGSISSCGGSGTTTTILPVGTLANPTFIPLAGLTASPFLDKSTGTVTYEIYLDPEPLFVAGDYTQAAVTKIDYTVGTTPYSESYVGVAGASDTASK